MAYPSLKISSLMDRCDKDIMDFKTLQQIKKTDIYTSNTLYIPHDDDTVDTLKENIKQLVDDLAIGGDYVDYISTKSLHDQQILWIKRTYLLYQILIFTNYFCLQESKYNILLKKGHFTYPFIHITEENLLDIDIGIFGSKTPTSDIDIGLQYFGRESILYYIMSIFENLFFEFTGKSSLTFDIEAYGNLLVLPNKEPSIYNIYFYLDTSHFNLQQYHDLLYLAGASIWRNISLWNTDHYPSFEHILNEIRKYINININIFELNNYNWFINSRNISLKYIKMFKQDEKKTNRIYYETLKEVENTQKKILNSHGYYDNDKNVELNPSEIFDIVKKSGINSIYKQENYICTPSIIHIVRLLQEKKKDLEKYATRTPGTYCNKEIQHLDPYCTIGKYGYLLSILEQIGFLYRFHMKYKNQPKQLNKKTKKYVERIQDGLLRIEQIDENVQKIRKGGTRRRRKGGTRRRTRRRRTRRMK